jgi:dihydroorotase
MIKGETPIESDGSVELIRRAKYDGIPVTAETTPHYFRLDHRAVLGYDTHAKVNPPLRTPQDIEAIKQGQSQGVIDVIATDHAPHSSLDKEVEFEKSAFGMIGLESALAVTMELVRDGILTLSGAISKLSCNAVQILRVPGGHPVEGGEADVAIVDLEHSYVLKKEDSISKSKNSPFIGKTLKGRNAINIVGGEIVRERDV